MQQKGESAGLALVHAAVDPDAWTHGSSEQRMEAFKSGYESGAMSACDTLNRGVYKS